MPGVGAPGPDRTGLTEQARGSGGGGGGWRGGPGRDRQAEGR